MSKPDWKTKPHERKRMTLQQENEALKKRINTVTYERDEYLKAAQHFRDQRNALDKDAERYRALRDKDVMVLDGEPKYLKGEDLDAYCDVEKENFWGASLTSMMHSITKTINSGGVKLTPTTMYVPYDMQAQAEKILKENNYGNDTGSKSKEADSKDSGHHTDILRYADWDGLWKQRGA